MTSTFLDGRLRSGRQRFNPLEWAARRGATVPGHITYDPHVVPQYRIRRWQRHDGTAGFTDDALLDILDLLWRMESYYRPLGAPSQSPRPIRAIRYTIGDVRIATVYRLVDVAGGTYPGQREAFSLPVRCEYVYADEGEAR